MRRVRSKIIALTLALCIIGNSVYDVYCRAKSDTVIIPDGYGTIISYMGYHKITDKTSKQYKMKQFAKKNGDYKKKKPEYYAMINGRILIATKQNIGNKLKVSIGSYVNVYFKKSNGKTKKYKCIIGDFKGPDADSEWGHYGGKGVVEVIYHNYKPPKGYNKNKNNPWGQGRVVKIKRVGKYKF